MNLQNHSLGQENEKWLRTEQRGSRRISAQGPGPYKLRMVIDGALCLESVGPGCAQGSWRHFPSSLESWTPLSSPCLVSLTF